MYFGRGHGDDGVGLVVRPQLVVVRLGFLGAPVEVLEGGLVFADAHGADLPGTLRFGALQHDNVTMLDAICHRVTANAQGELVGATAQRQAPLGVRVTAYGYPGGDLAEERYACRVAQKRQVRTAASAAALQAQLPLGLESPQVLTQGGVADVEGARQGREFGWGAGALVGAAQGLEDLQLTYWPWRHAVLLSLPSNNKGIERIGLRVVSCQGSRA